MRKLLLAATLSIGVTLSIASPAFADTDPSMDTIFSAAKAGHLDQAQTMIEQVLKDHPNSYKAHWVQAELFAKEGKTGLARSELGRAEALNPGLTGIDPRSVQELKAQLGSGSTAGARNAVQTRPADVREARTATEAGTTTHVPWGTILILAIVAGVLFMLFRRRRQPYPGQYPANGGPGMGGAPNAGYGPGYGPGPVGGGGGMGSGIAGGLASGLAVGAGVVAGETLAHRFMDGRGEQGGSSVIPSADAAQPTFSNDDMGGNDFGVNDGGSWDDGGGSGGGDSGGGDWS